MKFRLVLIALCIAVAGTLTQNYLASTGAPGTAESGSVLRAFEAGQSDVQVTGSGTVRKILSDDNDGSRHQRFIVDIGGGHTLLIAHNIDLAPRIAGLEAGDRVEFYGEYEWNEKGGVLHWTHHDPRGSHPGGWIRHDGKIYE